MDSNFDSTNIGGYKESNENVNIVKTEMQNKTDNGNSEFANKRVPMDGMEELLGQEKVPRDLGKKMDRKNVERSHRIKERHNERKRTDELSDLNEIISDAEAIENKSQSRFSPSENRQEERRKRRFIKKKKNISLSNPFEQEPKPGSKEGANEDDNTSRNSRNSRNSSNSRNSRNSRNGSIQEEENDDVSGYGGTSNGSEYTEESTESVSNSKTKWKSPSKMTKNEITSEKMDLLYRYSRLENNGYKSGISLTMRSPLETLRSEVSKLERMRNVQRSIRTQRKLLISFASGTEYVNKRYNPYKFALDGWSGEVLENVGDYDEVFEELHDKYSDSLQMAPELKLLTMVGGSGLMFHLSNTLFKSSTPQLNDILQNNPDIMAQIQREALNSMSATNAGDPMFEMMMNGVREKKRQQSQQQQWNGRPGYAPPRTSVPNPQPSNSNFNVGSNVNQVPQGQGIVNDQATMSGPQGFDDILKELNSSSGNGLINEKPEQKEVSTKRVRKKRTKKQADVIDLDM